MANQFSKINAWGLRLLFIAGALIFFGIYLLHTMQVGIPGYWVLFVLITIFSVTGVILALHGGITLGTKYMEMESIVIMWMVIVGVFLFLFPKAIHRYLIWDLDTSLALMGLLNIAFTLGILNTVVSIRKWKEIKKEREKDKL